MDQQSYKLVCISCGEEYPYSQIIYRCSRCGDLLECRIEPGRVFSLLSLPGRVQSMWRYRELLPGFFREVVTLEEGYTRLVKAERLAKILGVRELYVKMEGLNPTGSFKDRGMSVGVSMAKTLGSRQVVCASTGNTSASLAAYASRAGLKCSVYIPEGKIALGKLFQARMFGAEIYQVRGSFDEALKMVLETAGTQAYILNSVNPWRIEGQKTAAFELWEQTGGRTDYFVVLPVGNSGNIAAYWKGFKELLENGLISEAPRLIGVQAEGASPIVEAVSRQLDYLPQWSNPETIATAIRIGRPINWKKGVRAIRESGGTAVRVSDEEILSALRLLASVEGIATEPAGSAPIAAVRKLVEDGKLGQDDRVICIATGNMLKDTREELVSWNVPQKT
ncbi:MAG: threonine synthase [Candidatus Caldarchaeales archaeon]|nr:threonine synthase [Candidatus Caldarchaeales archaeon]